MPEVSQWTSLIIGAPTLVVIVGLALSVLRAQHRHADESRSDYDEDRTRWAAERDRLEGRVTDLEAERTRLYSRLEQLDGVLRAERERCDALEARVRALEEGQR